MKKPTPPAHISPQTFPSEAPFTGAKSGTIYGVGLGPGDADLMSVRAHRLVREARHIAFFRKAGRAGHARKIVEGLLHPDVIEFPMEYPVTTEILFSDPRYNTMLSSFYADCTAHLAQLATAGEDVMLLCEGDPFFYGSFMHLYTRLHPHFPVQVVPGITGMSAAWTATGQPITWGDDLLSVVMATLPEEALIQAISNCDALVVMKIGRNLPKLYRALEAAGRTDRAYLIQYASMEAEKTQALSEIMAESENGGPPLETLPYFSIVVVHGQGRRP